MRAVFTLAFKDLRLLWRDKAAVFWVIGFPLLMAVFFGSIFSGGGQRVSGMKLMLVDHDRSEYSIQFTQELEKSDALDVVSMPLDSARSRVRRGKAMAYLIVPEGFGESQGFGPRPDAQLQLGIDPSRKAEIGYLQGIIIRSSFLLLQRQFSDPTAMRDQLKTNIGLIDKDTAAEEELAPVRHLLTELDRFYATYDTIASDKSETSTDSTESTMDNWMSGPKIEVVSVTDDRARPASSFEITFPASIMWALIGCAASFGISIVQEKVRGTFLRLRIAPLSRAHILAGKGVACFLSCLAVCVLLLVIANLVFEVRLNHPMKLGLAVFGAVFCFVGLMMFISVLGRTEQAVGGVGWAMMLVFSMTGGGMVPLLFMPSWMQTISHFSPVKWGIVAIEGAIWRGYSYTELAFPFAVLIGIGLVTFSIGVYVLSRSDN